MVVVHKDHPDIELTMVKDTPADVVILNGKVKNKPTRIIASYFDATKLATGREYEYNRKLQEVIEKNMTVDPGVNLLVLGDFNGRLKSLEPEIRRNDINGNMIEKWTHKFALTHMNIEDRCRGVYTFGKPDSRGRSAIDHVLVNQ